MDPEAQRDLAFLLAELRRENRQQSGLDPALTPPDKATAYVIAGMAADALGWQVAGWKIAAAKPEMQRQLRTDAPIYGRVFAHKRIAGPAVVRMAEQCSPIPEPEYIAELGEDLPPRHRTRRVPLHPR